jgi:sugar/nucleoside kinase (ribokinase family)
MKTPSHRIVGTGLFALDVIVRGDGMTAPPTLGGSAGNVLWILGALGWKATPVGTIGQDSAARTVHGDFEYVDADTRFMLRSTEHSTPVIFQHQIAGLGVAQGATHRFTFTCPACGARRRPVWDHDSAFADLQHSLPPASVFFLDRPTKLGVALAEHYAASGTTVVFEPSAIGDDVDLFARAVTSAHIVKYADERIDSLEQFELRPQAVEIQTRGADGLRFRAPSLDDRWMSLGAFELPYVHDTAGAGDWCTAGLIFEMFNDPKASLRTPDYTALARALSFGQALSTLNCMTEGARGLLQAWSPSRVVRLARELSEARITALQGRNGPSDARVCEPRLEALADDVSQWFTSTLSSVDRLHCCPSS